MRKPRLVVSSILLRRTNPLTYKVLGMCFFKVLYELLIVLLIMQYQRRLDPCAEMHQKLYFLPLL